MAARAALLAARRARDRSHTARGGAAISRGRARPCRASSRCWRQARWARSTTAARWARASSATTSRELPLLHRLELGVTVPFTTFIGCAVARRRRDFERVSLAPVVGSTDADPFLAASPWVLVEDGRWRMWYASGTAGPRPTAAAGTATASSTRSPTTASRWRATGHVCIDFASRTSTRSPGHASSATPTATGCGSRAAALHTASATRSPTTASRGSRDDERAGSIRSGDGWESRYGRVRLRVRPRREAMDALQRQRLRRDRDRPGRAGGDSVNRAYAFVAVTVAFTVYGQLVIKWQARKAGDSRTAPATGSATSATSSVNPWVISSLLGAVIAALCLDRGAEQARPLDRVPVRRRVLRAGARAERDRLRRAADRAEDHRRGPDRVGLIVGSQG